MANVLKFLFQYLIVPVLVKLAQWRLELWKKTEEAAKLRKENLELKLEKAKKYAKNSDKESSDTDFSNMP